MPLSTRLRSEEGIALPTAVIALVLLTTLLIAFSVLSKSEPTIAANHARAAQARAAAESGIEVAAWALMTTLIPDPILGSVAAAPYNGVDPVTKQPNPASYQAVATGGGYFVSVKPGAAANERVVDAIGYAPTYSTTRADVAHRRLHATLAKIRWLEPPAALSVRGELRIFGNVLIDARADASCGARGGSFTSDDTNITGGAVEVYGYGDDVKNQRTGAPADITDNVPTSVFDDYMFSDADLDMLRQLAKCCGTYIGPGSPSTYSTLSFGPSGTPTITFNASNPFPRNGLIFVDTKSGIDPTETTPDSELPTVKITGNAAPVGQSKWNGWLVVNGKIDWQGNTKARGLVYAQNDLSWAGTETIDGAVMSRNIKDTSSTNIDSDLGGHATIRWDCAAARTGGNSLPTGWFVKAGSYREVSD
jgi:hypothetical protein